MILKIDPECISCFLRQAIEATEIATSNVKLQYQTLKKVAEYLNKIDLAQAIHIEIGSEIHRIVRKVTGNPDPYRDLKRQSNRLALKILSSTPSTEYRQFTSAVKMAAAGNIIDYGAIATTTDLKGVFAKALKAEIDWKKVRAVKRLVDRSKKILYICDNAGEIVFDKILVTFLRDRGIDVCVVVRGGAVLNDATMEDAEGVKMTKIAKVITTGTDVSGILLEECSDAFLKRFNDADLMISKGQGNLESLVNVERKPTTVYLLKVKCNPIAKILGSRVDLTEVVIQRKAQIK